MPTPAKAGDQHRYSVQTPPSLSVESCVYVCPRARDALQLGQFNVRQLL